MSNRPSFHQLEGLLEFLEQNSGIARGLLMTSQAKQQTKRKWAQLAGTLNALGGASKDGPGWAKYWAEKKCSIKRLCSQHAASIRQTGGGIHNTPVLSDLDKRFIAVMGGHNFASGDSHVVVNPFPQMQSATEDVQLETEVLIEVLEPHHSSHPPISPTGSPPQEPYVPPTQPTPSAPMPPQSNSATSAPRRRPRRPISRNAGVEMDRMIEIEER